MEANPLEQNLAQRLPVRRILVTPDEAGMRLDRFLLVHNPGAPPALAQRWLRAGEARVDGARASGNHRLEPGQEVRIPPFESREPAAPETGVPEWALRALHGRILWRDRSLLVLDKPHGMPVHGGSGQTWGVVDAMRLMLAREGAGEVPELCHRLDKETSGCLLFALDKTSARRMSAAFKGGAVDKTYWALIAGEPRATTGMIDQPLIKGNARGGERMVIAGGREGDPARTRYEILERFGAWSWVAAYPDTGRTHQIRVHFQWLGHPLAGDGKYGDPALNRNLRDGGLKRMFLHARAIRFRHPVTGAEVVVEARLDEALEGILAWCRRGVAAPGGPATPGARIAPKPDVRIASKPDVRIAPKPDARIAPKLDARSVSRFRRGRD
ncbi:Ribosomal large subunit pseudouridine synthase C [Candidatus Magnetaquicoccaceae bacterium FCR-1]|uniref:Pseudouridine synthase n=1 Tax=Candidatus Magnetaquiglobus chichijimensis TaxID=3141448 RepID=A0ABQ0C5W6_9PROT